MLEEGWNSALNIYRTTFREITDMGRNVSIMEDHAYLASVIRHNFEQHLGVTDLKIVYMPVFKASQELGDIWQQWKAHDHEFSYIQRYTEKGSPRRS